MRPRGRKELREGAGRWGQRIHVTLGRRFFLTSGVGVVTALRQWGHVGMKEEFRRDRGEAPAKGVVREVLSSLCPILACPFGALTRRMPWGPGGS